MADLPSITDFYSQAQKIGFGKKYNFKVTSIDYIPNDPGVGYDKNYLLYVESLNIPSRNIATTTVPYKSFDFVAPTVATFPDKQNWKINFFSDDKLLIRKMFEGWSEALYDNQTNSTYYDKGSISTNAASRTNDGIGFGYCNIKLQIVSETEEEAASTYTLYGAFPTQVGSMDYSISDNGSTVAKLPVTIAFQYFDVT